MDFINLLSEVDSKKLIELVSELKELFETENELINKSAELIEKGDRVKKNRVDLNNKSKDYIDYVDGKPKSNIDGFNAPDEFISLISRTNDYKIEETQIEDESKLIADKLKEINNKKSQIKEKVDKILLTSSKPAGKKINKEIGVVQIIGGPITENRDKLSKELSKIINCTITLINEMQSEYAFNVTYVENSEELNEFDKLKNYVTSYKNNRASTFDKQLEMVVNSVSEEKEEPVEDTKESEIVEEVTQENKEEVNTPTIENIAPVELPKEEEKVTLENTNEASNIIDMNAYIESKKEQTVDNTIFTDMPKEEQIITEPETSIIDNIVDTPVVEEPKPSQEPIAVIKDPVTLEVISEIRPDGTTVEPKLENIVGLDTPIEEQLVKQPEIASDEISISDIMLNTSELQTEIKEENGVKTLYILTNDKVTPNQIARATKDKLYNKIVLIFKGSYPETNVETVNSVNEVKVDNSFDINGFVANGQNDTLKTAA